MQGRKSCTVTSISLARLVCTCQVTDNWLIYWFWTRTATLNILLCCSPKWIYFICNLQMRMERAQFIVRHAFEEDEAGNETEAAELYMEAAQLCIDLVNVYRIMCPLEQHHSNKSHTVRQIFHWLSPNLLPGHQPIIHIQSFGNHSQMSTARSFSGKQPSASQSIGL